METTTAHSDIIAVKDPSAYITKDRQTLRGKRVGPILHLADERARLAQLTWNHFEIKRLGATIGAEISGVDLTTDLPQEVIEDIRQALHEYKVIFFRKKHTHYDRHVT
jgi:taurine dioxygenase